MLPDQVSNPGPLTYESGAPPIALRGPALTCMCCLGIYIYFPRKILRKGLKKWWVLRASLKTFLSFLKTPVHG